jgi:hypothetical protein
MIEVRRRPGGAIGVLPFALPISLILGGAAVAALRAIARLQLEDWIRVGALVALLVGCAVVFYALVRLELGEERRLEEGRRCARRQALAQRLADELARRRSVADDYTHARAAEEIRLEVGRRLAQRKA